MSYAKGPWASPENKSQLGNLRRVFDGNGKAFADILFKDLSDEQIDGTTRRLITCVNACSELPQDALNGDWSATGMDKYAKGLEDQRDALRKTVDYLTNALCDIGDIAHAKSTGPTVPDDLWEISRIAYDAMEMESRADATAPAIKITEESK